MLWLIGIGINGYKGISLHALEVLNTCNIVYLERFTSGVSDKDLQYLNSAIGEKGNNIILAQRWFVEDGREILEKAREDECSTIVVWRSNDCYNPHGTICKSCEERNQG